MSDLDAGRWKCGECGWIGRENETLSAPNPFEPTETIIGCPRCKAIDHFGLICDESGCSREATCGFPTKDQGYRRTCGDHMDYHPRAHAD